MFVLTESISSETLVAMLTVLLGFIVLDPAHNILTGEIYAPITVIPLPLDILEILWGIMFIALGSVHLVGITLRRNLLRRFCVGISFTFWVFLMALNIIGPVISLGWAYNMFLAFAQLITFIQLTYQSYRPANHV